MRFGKIIMVGVAASILFGSPVYAAGKKKKPATEWTSTWTYNKSSKTWKKKAVKKSTECWVDVYLRNRDKKK